MVGGSLLQTQHIANVRGDSEVWSLRDHGR
jgi:hypothetical protein